MYNLYFQCLFEQVAFRVLLELSKILLWSEFTDAITVCADERSRVMYACCTMCSVSIIFLMLWFTVIVWEACPCGKWCLDKDKLLAHILKTLIMLLWGKCGDGKNSLGCQRLVSGRDVFLLHYLHINITKFCINVLPFVQWSVRQTLVASGVPSSSGWKHKYQMVQGTIYLILGFMCVWKIAERYLLLYGWPIFIVL